MGNRLRVSPSGRVAIRAAVVVMMAMLGIAGPLRAQASHERQPTRVPVTVAVVERLPAGNTEPFLILRRADLDPRDVILLTSASADGRRLSSAVEQLLMNRAVRGDTAARTSAVRVRRRQPQAERPELPWAERVLREVRRAEPRLVAGVGVVRAIQIWLPPARPARGR
jgi:hypothetical protein